MPKKKAKETAAHAQRKQALGVSNIWDEVPHSTIVSLLLAYASMGDSILFGSSADRQVASIRVYRSGVPYSVYFRTLNDLPAALERLDRYMPSIRRIAPVWTEDVPDVQVKPTPKATPKTWIEVLNSDNVRLIEGRDERIMAFAREMARLGLNKVD